MELTLSLDIAPLPQPIVYTDKILLIGSCFTEHISERLAYLKFNTFSNPHGILFNPMNVAHSLSSYANKHTYTENDLFFLNELWNSWDHHTRFSHTDKSLALEGIRCSQSGAGDYIRQADWVIITLGSSFQYFLKDSGRPVANNHRAPAQWFEKRLLDIPVIVETMKDALVRVRQVNPAVRFIFTISPVRHIRDGVVANNRSKGRLIEAVHTLTEALDNTYYFPAYELVIDILRDYRFYDIDYVHPNYLATQFVWEQFVRSCISPQAGPLMQELQELAKARKHRPRFPDTEAHRRFMQASLDKIEKLVARYPFLDLSEERAYFSS